MVGTALMDDKAQWWAQRKGRLCAVVTERGCGTWKWWAQRIGGHGAAVGKTQRCAQCSCGCRVGLAPAMVGTAQWCTQCGCGCRVGLAPGSGGHNAVVQAQRSGGCREAQWGMVADEIVISVNESLTL